MKSSSISEETNWNPCVGGATICVFSTAALFGFDAGGTHGAAVGEAPVIGSGATPGPPIGTSANGFDHAVSGARTGAAVGGAGPENSTITPGEPLEASDAPELPGVSPTEGTPTSCPARAGAGELTPADKLSIDSKPPESDPESIASELTADNLYHTYRCV